MKKLIIIIAILILFVNLIYCQWYDPQSTNVTVLLEKEKNGKIEPYGTGFLLWNYDEPANPILITCKHLLGEGTLYVSINADTSLTDILKANKTEQKFILEGKRNWTLQGNKLRCQVDLHEGNYLVHDTLDIGAFLIDYPFHELHDDKGETLLKFANTLSIPKSGIEMRKNIDIGEEVYFVGFPFGIGTLDIINPLVRSGSIAWFSNNSTIFLLDAFSYGGNSGSPIFLKRIVAEPGKLEWSLAKLVGMIIGHQEIKLENILTQPDPNELKFEKGEVKINIGLARCIWSDDIVEFAKEAEKLEIE